MLLVAVRVIKFVRFKTWYRKKELTLAAFHLFHAGSACQSMHDILVRSSEAHSSKAPLAYGSTQTRHTQHTLACETAWLVQIAQIANTNGMAPQGAGAAAV